MQQFSVPGNISTLPIAGIPYPVVSGVVTVPDGTVTAAMAQAFAIAGIKPIAAPKLVSTDAGKSNRNRLGTVHTARFMPRPFGSVSAGYTLSSLWSVETDFDLVRLIYANDGSSAYTVSAASIAAVGQVGNGYTPLTSTGVPITPTAVTFNNAGLDGYPPSPAGSATTLTLGTTATADIPALGASDWMRMSSVPRSDGTLPLLMCRSYFAAPARVINTGDVLNFDTPSVNFGRLCKTFYQGGNLTLGTMSAPSQSGGFLSPYALQYFSRGYAATVLTVGDSLTQGHGSTSNYRSWGLIACATVSTPDVPVQYANSGWFGQVGANFYARGMADILLFKPQVVVIPVMSPNDNVATQAAADLGFSRAIDLANFAMRQGAIPILTTPLPWSGITTTTLEAFRTGLRDRLKAMGNRFLIADFDAAVTDGGNPARIQPVFVATDSQHLNDAGQAACAAALVPLLVKALS